MSENQELVINRIPSPTWNWLHMNETAVRMPSALSLGNVDQDIPSGLSTKEISESKLSDLTTGLGEEFTNLLKTSGIKAMEFSVPRDKKIDAPVRLDFSYQDGCAVANAVDITVEEGASLLVIMNFDAAEKTTGTAAIQTRYKVSKNAKLHIVQVQKLSDGYDFYNDIGGDVAEEGKFVLTQLILNGNHSYYGVYNHLDGKKSETKTDIGYLADRDEVLDMNYVNYQTGRKTKSELNCDGVLRNQADKLFRGTIDFRRGCGGSKGDELENVLLMDDDVINRTIPVILCDEEDVEGNHGASIGKLDESLLFYLTSRGMSLEAIYEMMARARIDAVSALIPDETTRSAVAAYLGDVED